MYITLRVLTAESQGERSMSRRRSRLDIVLNVLSSVRDGTDKPTRIMYAANLSWKPTQRILNSLVAQGFLREIEDTGSRRTKKRFEITEKGTNLLRYFEGAKDLLVLEEIIG
jgi:predicted transcriptional regulator